ncbi:MAG: AEC family transporter, partial [Alphaproteobacteria bacterium]
MPVDAHNALRHNAPMPTVISSLLPVFAVIALGQALRRARFLPDEVWPPLDRLNYFVLFPALILHTLMTADLGALAVGPMAGALLAAVATMLAVVAALRWLVPMSGPQYSSVFQGTLRWNGFVAIAALGNLYGEPGVALAAIAIAVLVPTLNVLSVLVLTRNAGGPPPTQARTLGLMVRNPLILACAAGIGWQLTGLTLPAAAEMLLDVLGSAALALGLLSVGAALRLAGGRASLVLVALTTGLKLAGVPLLVAAWTWVFGVEGLARTAAIMVGSVPTATSSYILARQLGGDAELMALLVTSTTVAAMVTMPAAAWLAG